MGILKTRKDFVYLADVPDAARLEVGSVRSSSSHRLRNAIFFAKGKKSTQSFVNAPFLRSAVDTRQPREMASREEKATKERWHQGASCRQVPPDSLKTIQEALGDQARRIFCTARGIVGRNDKTFIVSLFETKLSEKKGRN